MTHFVPERSEYVYTSCYCEENVWKLCECIRQNDQTQNNSLLDESFVVFISNHDRTVPLWCQRASTNPNGLVVWDYHVILITKHEIKKVSSQNSTSSCDTTDAIDVGMTETMALSYSNSDSGEVSKQCYSCENSDVQSATNLPAKERTEEIGDDTCRRCYTDSVKVYDLDTTLDFPSSFEEYIEEAICSEETMPDNYRRLFRVISARQFLDTFASDRSHMLKEDKVTCMATPPTYPPIRTESETNNIQQFISMTTHTTGCYGDVLTLQELIRQFTKVHKFHKYVFGENEDIDLL